MYEAVVAATPTPFTVPAVEPEAPLLAWAGAMPPLNNFFPAKIIRFN
jgi:hypothetical protein